MDGVVSVTRATKQPRMTTIHDLEPQSLLAIFSHLSAKEAAKVGLVHRQWREAAADEQFWRQKLLEDWSQDEKCEPSGNSCQSYRLAYAAWARQLGDFSHPQVMKDIVHAWMQIKAWLSQNFPPVLDSLQPGVSQSDLDQAASELGTRLPPVLQAIYRIHDGQLLWWDCKIDEHQGVPGSTAQLKQMAAAQRERKKAAAAAATGQASTSGGAGTNKATGDSNDGDSESDDADDVGGPTLMGPPHPSIFYGMFGGYAFYDHMSVTRLLPLKRALWWTQHMRTAGVIRMERPCLMFAASFNFKKRLLVDLATGDIVVNCQRQAYIPAAPPGHNIDDAGPRHGLYAWFMEYSRRLASGWYAIDPIDQDFPQTRAINLFPRVQPGLVQAVTRGVCVSASVIYAPECSTQTHHLFSYCIRFHLQTEEEQQAAIEAAKLAAAGSIDSMAADRHLVRSCQLISRHWVIHNEQGQQEDEVKGQGVIGKHPVLTPGCEPFSYQSCTNQAYRLGYMKGDFKFVEGTINKPTGGEWDVVCPQFTLEIPDFIF